MIPMTCSNLSANNWICFLNLLNFLKNIKKNVSLWQFLTTCTFIVTVKILDNYLILKTENYIAYQVEYICDQHLAGENWFLFTWLHVFLWERLLLHMISFIVLSSSSINFFHLVLMMYLQSGVQSASWTWLGFFLQYNDTLFKRVGHNLITYRMYITRYTWLHRL